MIKTEKFSFAGADGQMLDGRLELPLYGPPRAAALFAHCFTCGKQSRAATRISSALAKHGIAVLRFDFTGLGSSEGEFANAGFVSNMEDLTAAAAAMRKQGLAPSLLIGHSLGGSAVIGAASSIPECKAVATLGAPFDTTHVFRQFGGGVERVEAEGEAEVSIAGRKFRVAKGFLEQGRNQPQAERLAKLGRALLVMHSPTDDLVGIDNASQIFLAAKHPKSFIALDGADHLLTTEGSADYAASMIAAWSERYFPRAKDAAAMPAEGTVTVSTAGGKFAQWVRTPHHALIADEPESFGGNDDGPTPYDLLLASLGTCTSMTIKMYADRKKIPLESVSVDLEHSRNHQEDCVDCDKAAAQIQVIDRSITLTGDLTSEQRAKLIEIADKCPVHRTLEGELHIHTTAVG